MELQEFVEAGYLQEVNRQFFHPLGLALVVNWDDRDAKYTLHSIADAREDPEGYTFDGFDDFEVKRGLDIIAIQADRKYVRKVRLGFAIQPLETDLKSFDETLMKCNLCVPPREMLGQYWSWHQHVEHGDHTELHLSREVYPDGSVGDIKREWCGGDGKCEKQCGGCARL